MKRIEITAFGAVDDNGNDLTPGQKVEVSTGCAKDLIRSGHARPAPQVTPVKPAPAPRSYSRPPTGFDTSK